VLTEDDILRRDVIEHLMCYLTVDLEQVAHEHGANTRCFLDNLDRLEPLRREGMVILDGWRVTVPDEARLAIRSVASVFDAWLINGEARHAAAV
jgi:oxygen-independent coproporphyrinogen-3 oxidase